MAQMTGGLAAVGGKLEISTNNSDWTDISGWAAGISFSGYDRQSGEAFTFDGDTAVVKFGKLNPTECEVKLLYTEETTGGWKLVWGQHITAGGGMLMVRWSPKGGDTTDEYRFTSGSDAKATVILPPDGEAGPGDPVMAAFSVKSAAFTQSAVT